ncbi:pectate lyase [Flaviramulus sp. BrNp1-15]|uniref:pectate lyase n=1 Tax=Flaviramulus sp. BrNp1-15 TaxID=2916754 RepID=UPI001EE8BC96|nr:pectate lyase [Flaviramulus sp. BrNp1-15]ULC59023.1 pectate lyase [Flaviramulus sp. BrNp1-15]
MKFYKHSVLFLLFVLFNCYLEAQVHDRSWRRIVNQEEGKWFSTQEAKNIAENVLLYQRDIGGWPKNIQMQIPLSKSEKNKLKLLKSDTKDITTDNGATIQEMLFLSKMFHQIPDEKYKTAFLKGLDYILEAQYDNGGWPQFYPLREGYYSHITYNDDSMVNILKLLKEIKNNTGFYSIKPSTTILKQVEDAFNKGVDCVLKTQYVQNGVLTAWCAQHDAKTLQPAKARSYELPSLSGKESAQIVLLLMDIENPSNDIKNAVVNAVNWFNKVKITGIDVKRTFRNRRITSKKIVNDNSAPPLWARFMELEDNTPFFCDRDGVKKSTLAEIGEERRNGYAWYTREPQEMLNKFDQWEKLNKIEISKKIENEYNVVVAKDGTGDYSTIQDAIYASKAFPYQRVIINIKDGVYNEKVHVFSWNTKISLIGESKENTIVTFNDYFDKINLGRNSTFHTSTLLVEGNDFQAKNLTVKNTSGPVGQAVALSVNANRCYFENCAFTGFQDTVYTAGEGFKQYFKNCYIEGTTDFIFGEATVLFEDCIIHSKSNSYITAASTPENQEFGYVFKNCKLTANNDVSKVYLGRPWRIHAKTVFINCEMGNHILPEGWHNWKKPDAEKTTFYAEYNNLGAGFQPEQRVKWSHQLTKKESKKYTKKNILGDEQKSTKGLWYEN